MPSHMDPTFLRPLPFGKNEFTVDNDILAFHHHLHSGIYGVERLNGFAAVKRFRYRLAWTLTHPHFWDAEAPERKNLLAMLLKQALG